MPDLFQKASSVTPDTPTNLSIDPSGVVSGNTSTWQTTLFWDEPLTPPTNYEVWRKEVSNGNVYHLIATISGATAQYVDDTRPPAMPALDLWTYKVRGKNGTTLGAFSNETQVANGIDFNNSGETSLSYPLLVMSFGSITIQDLLNLTSISMPLFVRAVQDFIVQHCVNLTSVNLNSFQQYGDFSSTQVFNMNSCPLLTTLNLSTLVYGAGNFDVSDDTTLSTLNLGTAVIFQDSGNVFEAFGCALPSAQINAILILLENPSALTNWTIDLDLGTNGAPTGAGITAKNQLIANGCTVNTN